MPYLSALKVVISKRSTHLSPVVQRRNKLLAKLHEQLEGAKARVEGRDLTLKRSRNAKNKETGERSQLEQLYKVKPWWYVNESGKTVF